MAVLTAKPAGLKGLKPAARAGAFQPRRPVVCSAQPWPANGSSPASRLRVSEAAATAEAPTEKVDKSGRYGIFSYDISNEDSNKIKDWKKTMRVVVSGAAGAISNHLLFMLASGEVFGADQPISLQLLGSDKSAEAIEGVAMELEDSLYPLLREVIIGTDPLTVFKDADWALLIGAKPRGPGMERSALLDINGQIFQAQGRALNDVASSDCKVLVVGNPCNTNALIAMENAPKIPRRNFHALTRLDENRAKCQLALKAGKFYTSVSNLAVWGNHSTTQVPDFVNARIGGKRAQIVIKDDEWLKNEFTPTVANRGGALIKKWGRSSAASTAVSIADHLRSLYVPTAPGDCFSTAVCTDGNPYGITEGLIFSMPCRSTGDGNYEVIDDFFIDDWLREKIKVTEDELVKEKNCVGHLIPNADIAVCEIKEDTMLPGEA
ncbi:hypothetical protein N2152v2_009565 [Parachlorella kessleri]